MDPTAGHELPGEKKEKEEEEEEEEEEGKIDVDEREYVEENNVNGFSLADLAWQLD